MARTFLRHLGVASRDERKHRSLKSIDELNPSCSMPVAILRLADDESVNTTETMDAVDGDATAGFVMTIGKRGARDGRARAADRGV